MIFQICSQMRNKTLLSIPYHQKEYCTCQNMLESSSGQVLHNFQKVSICTNLTKFINIISVILLYPKRFLENIHCYKRRQLQFNVTSTGTYSRKNHSELAYPKSTLVITYNIKCYMKYLVVISSSNKCPVSS